VPTYEYRCKACGQELEVVQSFTDDALTTCAACGGPLRKVFGNVGIAFKGSGFYKNDSRGKSTATATSTDKSSEAGSSSADKGGAGTDAGSPTKSDGAAPSSPAPTPKADTAKTSATTT
jgi:putative FmdB family regulatory protein